MTPDVTTRRARVPDLSLFGLGRRGGVAMLVAGLSMLLSKPALAQDLILTGELTGADHQTYREIPFQVPAGTGRITVELDHGGRDARTTVDLGLIDPERFRGWSGGNKRRFTISAETATPSYLPGPLPGGIWRLVLGVPNIRGETRADFTAKIWFEPQGAVFQGFSETPLREGPGWFRGDLHSHTGHSDGYCRPRGRATEAGVAKVPCPAFRTVERAAERGLDFIAVTDHNATSHVLALSELQAFFDRVLVIPGREITTFRGHANVFGPTAFIDFQVGSPRAPDINAVIAQVANLGGVFSINHPSSPSGEACMGCGWTAAETDWSRVQAVEVINGGSMRAMDGRAETALSGIPFWEALLNQGLRPTAIGGSDNHDADLSLDTPSAIGRPTTVVWAEALSQPAILAGIRSGRVFIDLDGDPARSLDLVADAAGETAGMGSGLAARGAVEFTAVVTGLGGGRIEVVQDGRPLDLPDLDDLADADSRTFQLRPPATPSWVRINGRDAADRLVLIGNPIYLNR